MTPAIALLLVLQGEELDFGPVRTAGGASVRRLKLPRADPQRPVDLFFSRDGGSFYLGESGGRVRRYSASDLRPLASTRFPAGLAGVHPSRLGVVALNAVQSQLNVLDPDSLEARRSHAVRDVEAFATGPELDIAFMTRPKLGLATIDLDDGRITREHQAGRMSQDFARRVTKPDNELVFLSWGGLQNAQVSPDGRHLYCATDRHLHRLALSGPDLLWEEAASFQGGPLRLSPDSRLVLVPGGRWKPSLALDAADLRRSVCTFSEEHGIVGLAADAVGRTFFAAEGDATGNVVSVAVFDTRGTRTAAVEVGGPGRIHGRMAARPSGKAVAVPLDDGVIWVEWK